MTAIKNIPSMELMKRAEHDAHMESAERLKHAACLTFNRDMVWLDGRVLSGNSLIAYSKTPRLALSGENAASDWWMDPAEGECRKDGAWTVARLQGEGAALLVMHLHEFLVAQHPVLDVELASGPRSAAFEVVFARDFDYGTQEPLRTLFAEKPARGRRAIKINLAELLAKKGYTTRYMRVRLLVRAAAGSGREIRLNAWSDSQPVLVPQLPQVFVHKRNAPVRIHAVFAGKEGMLLHGPDVAMEIKFAGKSFQMREKGRTGIFQGNIYPASTGTFRAKLSCTEKAGGKVYESHTDIGMTDGKFAHLLHDKNGKFCGYARNGRHLGFLSGSTTLCDLVPAVGVGTPKEEILLDANDFARKFRNQDRLHGILFTSLNDEEMRRWLEHRRDCGYRLFLMANWSPDILNAGGTISPYGAELVMRVMSFCRDNGIYLKVEPTHDTFFRAIERITPNMERYLKAGFMKNLREDMKAESENIALHGFGSWLWCYMFDQWCRPAVQRLTRSYVRQFLGLFRNDTSILLITPFGEGDPEMGTRIVNPFCDFIRRHDGNHILCFDQKASFFTPVFKVTPEENPENQDFKYRLKYRHHRIGAVLNVENQKSDTGMAVVYKFFTLSPSGGYGEGDCIDTTVFTSPIGLARDKKIIHPISEEVRLAVRDFLWMSLLHGVFAAYNWNEMLMAEEHRLPALVSDLMDWKHFKKRVPPVMVRVGRIRGVEDVDLLNRIERIFAKTGLDYGYIWDHDPIPLSSDLYAHEDRNVPPYLVLNAGIPKLRVELVEKGCFPAKIRKEHFVRLESNGYLVNSLISEDLNQMIIYVRNSSNYLDMKKRKAYFASSFAQLRGDRKPFDFSLELAGLGGDKKQVCVFDLDTGKEVVSDRMTRQWRFAKRRTEHDFVCIVRRCR